MNDFDRSRAASARPGVHKNEPAAPTPEQRADDALARGTRALDSGDHWLGEVRRARDPRLWEAGRTKTNELIEEVQQALADAKEHGADEARRTVLVKRLAELEQAVANVERPPIPKLSLESQIDEALAAPPAGSLRDGNDGKETRLHALFAQLSADEGRSLLWRIDAKLPEDKLVAAFLALHKPRQDALCNTLKDAPRREALAQEQALRRPAAAQGLPAGLASEPEATHDPAPATGLLSARHATAPIETLDVKLRRILEAGESDEWVESQLALCFAELDARMRRELAERFARHRQGSGDDVAARFVRLESPVRRRLVAELTSPTAPSRAVPSPTGTAASVAPAAASGPTGTAAPVTAALAEPADSLMARDGLLVVEPRTSPAEAERDDMATRVAAAGPGVKLPPVFAAPASSVPLAPVSAASKDATNPLDAFVAIVQARGLSLSPAHPVLDRTFSAHPVVETSLSSASGPPAGQAAQIEWQLFDHRSAALSGLSSLWGPLQPESPLASFPVQQPGDYQVTADILHGGRKLVRIAAPLHVERSPDALHAAMSMAPEARRAEQADRRSAVADASKPAGERKRLGDERAMLEFAAHEHGDQAPAMPDPGPHAVDFGAAQAGAPALPDDLRWVVSTDPVFLRAMVEREYAKGGELAVLELIGHMQNKANLARDRQTSPAEGERLWRLGWDIASAMGQQYELLKQENALFLADYERTAHHVVDFTLTQSEQRTLAEVAKYGITREEVTDIVETSDRGWKRKQRTVYGGGDTAGGKELATAAAELVASQREIDTMRARVARAQLDLFGAKSPDLLSPGHTRHPEQVEPLTTLLAELERKSAAAEQAHLTAGQKREEMFPVLTSYRKVSDHRVTFDVSKLEKLGGADSRREEIAPHLFGILDNIKKTREGLKPGGDLSIWKEDRVRQLTAPQMLIVPGSVRERAVLEKTAQEKRGGWGEWAIAALTAGLAVLAAIPTGGGSLAVGVVAISEVAGAALDVYLLADQFAQFDLQKAAAGTDMDKARAISAEDPSLFWLALNVVLTGVSLGVAAKSFRQLRHARDAGKVAKTTAELDDALATIHAEHQAGHISADAAMKLEDEVMAAHGAARGESAATSGKTAATGETSKTADTGRIRQTIAEPISQHEAASQLLEEIERNAGGLRRPAFETIEPHEMERLKQEFADLGGDPEMLSFNQGTQTGYRDRENIIRVRGDVNPVEGSLHPRSAMSSRAVLGHELGHAAHRGTKLPIGAWNDEFRASYWAAKNLPNLSEEDRIHLLLDAMERAKEAGVTIRVNALMRGILYGY